MGVTLAIFGPFIGTFAGCWFMGGTWAWQLLTILSVKSAGRSRHHYPPFFGILKVNQDRSKSDEIINLGPDTRQSNHPAKTSIWN